MGKGLKGFVLLAIGGILVGGIVMAGEIYRWVDKNGTIFFSDSPPPEGSFKKQNVEDEIDKVIDQKKKVDKQTDLSEADKSEEKLKIEMDYEKKAKSIRNYNRMREELRALDEKYQEKNDQLDSQLRRGPDQSSRADINQERERIRREYLKEMRRIKEHYGYY